MIKHKVRNNLCAMFQWPQIKPLLFPSKDMSLISPTPCHPIVWNPSELKSCKDTGTLGPAVYRNLCQSIPRLAFKVLLHLGTAEIHFIREPGNEARPVLTRQEWGPHFHFNLQLLRSLPIYGVPLTPRLLQLLKEWNKSCLCHLVWNQFMMLVHGNHSFHCFFFFPLLADVISIRSWPLDLGICNSPEQSFIVQKLDLETSNRPKTQALSSMNLKTMLISPWQNDCVSRGRSALSFGVTSVLTHWVLWLCLRRKWDTASWDKGWGPKCLSLVQSHTGCDRRNVRITVWSLFIEII